MSITKTLCVLSLCAAIFLGCSSENETATPPTTNDGTTTFRITLTNAANYLATHIFNTPDGDAMAGPLDAVDDSYSIEFAAVPGAKLSFATMSAATNDHFFAPDGDGIDLFDGNGDPIGATAAEDITDQVELWDAGTEEEDASTIATEPGGADAGDPDDDDTVRSVATDVSADLSVELEYDDGTKMFTLTLTREGTAIITPGLVVIHTQADPLFKVGEADRGNGLERIAEAGVPTDLNMWFNEEGNANAPLRLASSLTPLSPGVAYTFSSDSDPSFTQGEAVGSDTGLEGLAEDGDNQPLFDYLTAQNVTVAKSSEAGGAGPGSTLTFELDAKVGEKLGLATMFVESNDWLIATNNAGIDLFDSDDMPIEGSEGGARLYLYDMGTEVDEPVGQGDNQPARSDAANTGDADTNTSTRRVESIDDVQFGKGVINSTAGVVAYEDPRGGYNLVSINIEVVP